MKKTVDRVVPCLVAPPIYWLEGVKIDYSLTPEQAVARLSVSNPDIALWPEDKMGLWNGGKAGILERATLPIFWDKYRFTTAQGRQKQEVSKIGFVWPVEIVSLAALPENDPQRIKKELNKLGIWSLVVLRISNKELWRRDGDFRPFFFYLDPDCSRFGLGYTRHEWDPSCAMVGAPQQVP